MALPNIPGFLGTIKAIDPNSVGPFFMQLYNYAWFVGFGASAITYYALTAIAPPANIAATDAT